MGGALFVGVRHTMDGKPKEALMNRWTNDFPWRFMMPTFQDQGEELRKFVTENPDDPKAWPRVEHDIYLSEYGLVLIDFPSKSVFSRQDYCAVGRLYFTCSSSAWEDTRNGLKELTSRNMVSAFRLDYTKGRDYQIPVPDDEFRTFVHDDKNFPKPGSLRGSGITIGGMTTKQLEKALEESERINWNFEVRLKHGLWTINGAGGKYDTSRKELQAWLKDHGWKSEIRKGISFNIDEE